ncbi:MAG: DUF1365 domain-containing protein [Dehalococcoidia bacterium]
MTSRLYEGRVWHTRREPQYTFEYSVWYLSLDLTEMAEVDQRLRLFSHNRFNLTSMWDRDYLILEEPRPQPLALGSIELLTMPRILNHVFNPVSFLLTRNADGAITDVTAEVHNTWSERHLYHLRRENDGADKYTSSATKAFYVSPFIDMKREYRFELREDGDGRLRVRIDEYDGDAWFFGSGIDVRPRALTDANLAQLLLKYPFVNLKTVAMIHWQGLRIWRRGERFRANPRRRNEQRRTATGEP